MKPDLVFDVGMNRGEDSAHYLSKGFRVVAIEANPNLVEQARGRFQKEIAAGQLVIEGVGIAEQNGQATFWINDENDDFSAFEREIAGRRGMACHSVNIECVTFDSLLQKHGVPYYLKVDIERADRHCIECLQASDLPRYVSIEAHELDYLMILRGLGYRHFKIIDQMRHNSTLPNFSNENLFSRTAKRVCWYADRVKNKGKTNYPPGGSGPFGDDTPGQWQSLEEVAYNWLHFHRGYHKRGNLNRRSWYDFHAKLG
ncbi:MAG: FkbM family methyltransferase [Planctomycetaceae bacterium]